MYKPYLPFSKRKRENYAESRRHFYESKNIFSQPIEDEYENNEKAGIALIFNQKNVEGLTYREGSQYDCDNLKRTLLKFGYDVRVFNDMTATDLRNTLRKAAQEDHSNNDCLIVVAMSHGFEGQVCACDTQYPVEDLWNPFLGQNCKTLINKPKLFFIQACRGSNYEKAVTYKAHATRSRSPSSFLESQEFKAIKHPNELNTVTYTIPNTADVLIMYSTFEKCKSFRNVQSGTFFIKSLCEVLNEAASGAARTKQGAELLQLLTAVNRKVAYKFKFGNYKLMPNFLSTLTKTFYIRVKTKQT